MLTIRLQRTGKKNQADFRIVAAEKTAHVSKKFTDILGSYNPRRKTFQIDEVRLKELLAKRAEVSPTVHNLLVSKGLIEAKKVKAFRIPKEAAPAEPKAEGAANGPAPAQAQAPEQPAPESPAEQPSEQTA